jgi:hypothetical protein
MKKYLDLPLRTNLAFAYFFSNLIDIIMRKKIFLMKPYLNLFFLLKEMVEKKEEKLFNTYIN